jgi:hypothetical protein
VQRPGREQRKRGFGGSPPTTTQHRSQRRRGRGVSPDYGNPARTHAEQSKAKRSGQAVHSREEGRRGLPSTGTQLARTPKKATRTPGYGNPSARAHAADGEFGVSPDYGTTQYTHEQKKTKRSDHAKRSKTMVPLDRDSNQRLSNGPRDEPLCGALSFIQKPLHLRGIQNNWYSVLL